jgi:YD repeat-containing protein
LRVNKIITKANVNDTSPQIKDYYYYNSLNPSQSTGSAIFAPRYDNYVTLYVNSTYGGGPSAGEDTYTYYMMTSNSLINLYPYPAPVYYSSVIESYGDNFANGGTEHHFQLMPDKPGNSISGNYIPSAPLNSYSWENGLELYSCTFKMSGNIQIPLKKIYTHYNIDSRVNQQFTGYLVNKKYSTSFQYTPPSADQLNAYDLESYSHFQRWVYPDTVTTQTYDQSGQNYVTEVNVSTYGNLSHAMLTKNASSTSDGRREITRYIYPQDTTLTGDEETGRQALISNYMLGTKLISIQTLNSTLVSADKVSYHVFPNGLVLPQTYNVQIGTNTAENRVTFTGYNNNGKLLSQSLINGPVVSYQWGYNSLYPVAQASNAAANDIFYDSFEEGDGNNSAIAKTGHYSYSGAYAHTLSGLDNGSYTLSYWQNNGSGWVLVTNPETVSGGSYTITLSGQIDDVRFYPAAAQMTTYTYDPLVGMTSSTDAKNEVTYYEYDPFQRLMNVKDKDGNIVKHMFYHYQGQ